MLKLLEIETSWQREGNMEEEHNRVMIIDDDGDIRSSLVYALDSCGFPVTSCENGTEALLNSMFEEFDYFITDYDMPGMDGIALVRRLRERFPRAVIIGTSGKDLGEEFLRAGANDFLRKPFVPYRLAMMIDGGDILA